MADPALSVADHFLKALKLIAGSFFDWYDCDAEENANKSAEPSWDNVRIRRKSGANSPNDLHALNCPTAETRVWLGVDEGAGNSKISGIDSKSP